MGEANWGSTQILASKKQLAHGDPIAARPFSWDISKHVPTVRYRESGAGQPMSTPIGGFWIGLGFEP